MKKITSGEKLLNKLYKRLHFEYKKGNNFKATEKIKKLLERLNDVSKKAIENDKYDLLKELYYNKYVIKNIPESHFNLLDKISVQRGEGKNNFTEKQKDKISKAIIDDQKNSLDEWLDYFYFDNDLYPIWAKYWAFQGMIKLGHFDKNSESFTKRTAKTTSPFIELNREILALSIDYMEKYMSNDNNITDDKLDVLLENGSFAKIYEYIYVDNLHKKNSSSSFDGKWIKYPKNSDYKNLVKDLRGKGTDLCIAAENIAKKKLLEGDIHIYYTLDINGEYENPKIVISINNAKISEVRGTDKNQHLETGFEEILENKLKEFSDKDLFYLKLSDMKKLTYLFNNQNNDFSKEDIIFLYEVERKITGFGYKADPRISEIKKERDFIGDLSFALNCSKNEISYDENDLIQASPIKYFEGEISENIFNHPSFMMPEIYVGNLDLNFVESSKNLKLPKILNGNLSLNNLKDCDNLILPEIINGNLSLSSLINVDNLLFPKQIMGSLDLSGIKKVDGLKLPNFIFGFLNLNSLEEIINIEMPDNMIGNIYLNSLSKVKKLKLPTTFEGTLNLEELGVVEESLELPINMEGNLLLSKLTSINKLILPKNMMGKIYLNELAYIDFINFPENMTDTIFLDSLINANKIIVPNSLGCTISMKSLKSVIEMKFPHDFAGYIYLSSVENLNGITLPINMKGKLDLSSVEYINEGVLPAKMNGWLILSGLLDASNLELPEGNYSINLSSLRKADNLKLPNVINGDLNLKSLISADNLKLPVSISGVLTISSMNNLVGLELPDDFYVNMISYKSNYYSLEEFIALVNNDNNMRKI